MSHRSSWLIIGLIMPLTVMNGNAQAQCEATETAVFVTPHPAWPVALASEGDLLFVGAYDLIVVHEFDPASSQWNQIAAFTEPTESYFGASVSLDGGTLVSGAPRTEVSGLQNAGTAWVYPQPQGGWSGDWQGRRLVPTIPQDCNLFGWSVAMSGEWVIVGAPRHEPGLCPICPRPECEGAAYVFRKPEGGWLDVLTDLTETQKLTPSGGAPGDNFGRSVAISGDFAFVGADRHNSSGAVFVYQRNGNQWIDFDVLSGVGNLNGRYGQSVAMDGGAAVVGAPNEPSGGRAYVYRLLDGTSWIEEDTLSDPAPDTNQNHGFSVSIHGDVAVAGAPFYPSGLSLGRALLYRFDGADWAVQAALEAAEPDPRDDGPFNLGWVVNIRDDRAVVAASDATTADSFVFVYPNLIDCDANGIADPCDISQNVLHDIDGNGLADECEEIEWVDSGGGNFDDPANWATTTPGPFHQAVFDAVMDATPSYQVTLPAMAGDVMTDRLIVRSEREVRVALDGASYTVAGSLFPDTPAVVVGEAAAIDARLRVEATAASGEGLFANVVSIGDGLDSIGQLRVTGSTTALTTSSLFVGVEGDGTLIVDGGATATTTGSVSVGYMPGSSGDIQLLGAGTQWTTSGDNFTLGDGGNGSLTINGGASLVSTTLDGAVLLAATPGSSAIVTIGVGSAWTETDDQLQAGVNGPAVVTLDAGQMTFNGVSLSTTTTLQGNGTVTGDLINVGEIRPGLARTPGTLTLSDTYRQVGIPPGGTAEESGSLFIDVGTAASDQLIVNGINAELGGGLFVELVGATPTTGQSFPFLNADVFVKNFDVALTPGFGKGDDRFLKVEFSLGPGPQTASLVVATLDDLFAFGGPSEVSISGSATDVATGDFDDDTFLDIAVTVADTVGGTPGEILVLLNDGFGGIAAVLTTFVGNELTGIAVDDFEVGGIAS